MSEIVRRRNLPHIEVDARPYFVTGCLRGSISAVGLKKIKDFRLQLEKRSRLPNQTESERKRYPQKLIFKFVDELLDHQPPVKHLQDDRLAKVVQDSFLHFAGERYDLLAFVVMPSHHHWLFQPREDWICSLAEKDGNNSRSPREIISHTVQSFTAHRCNEILGKRGSFWQQETWDHFARNDDETARIIHYIEQNPVAAQLVESRKDYPWSSAKIRHGLGLSHGQPIPRL